MPHLLLITGSTRASSTNTALLRTIAAAPPAGVTCELHDGLKGLPQFDPDDDHDPLPAPVAELRAALGRADALLICTPEYAGALPGSFKNLLDWTVGGPEMDRMPVAWINAAGPAAPTGAADAHASLAKVLGYVNADVVEEACVRIPVLRSALGEDGLVADAEVREAANAAVAALAAALPRA